MTRLGLIKRLALVTSVIVGALNYVAFVRLGFAGQIPDLNPLGASPEDIICFRDALGFEGRALFNGTYRPLDWAMITCLTGLLILVAWFLKPRKFWWTVAVLGLFYAGADIFENQRLAIVVNVVSHPQEASYLAQINLATRVKFAALLLAGAAILTSWRQPKGE